MSEIIKTQDEYKIAGLFTAVDLAHADALTEQNDRDMLLAIQAQIRASRELGIVHHGRPIPKPHTDEEFRAAVKTAGGVLFAVPKVVASAYDWCELGQ